MESELGREWQEMWSDWSESSRALVEVTTTPVLVEATLTPAVAATATSSPVMVTCSNVRWSGMESEWGWEPETDQGSALMRDAWSVGRGKGVSVGAMEVMLTLASAPAPVRDQEPELVIGSRAASSTTDQGGALVRDARSVGSGREILVEAMEAMEEVLALTSVSALVGRPESKPVAGRRAGIRGEAWERLGMTMSTRGSMASQAVEAMKRRIVPMAARRGVKARRGTRSGMSGGGTAHLGTADFAVGSVWLGEGGLGPGLDPPPRAPTNGRPG